MIIVVLVVVVVVVFVIYVGLCNIQMPSVAWSYSYNELCYFEYSN